MHHSNDKEENFRIIPAPTPTTAVLKANRHLSFKGGVIRNSAKLFDSDLCETKLFRQPTQNPCRANKIPSVCPNTS